MVFFFLPFFLIVKKISFFSINTQKCRWWNSSCWWLKPTKPGQIEAWIQDLQRSDYSPDALKVMGSGSGLERVEAFNIFQRWFWLIPFGQWRFPTPDVVEQTTMSEFEPVRGSQCTKVSQMAKGSPRRFPSGKDDPVFRFKTKTNRQEQNSLG